MFCFITFASATVTASPTHPPPNVLILLTDDQGWGDTEYNCENSTGLCARTPNLSQLARSEHTALFHRFYAAASVCSPTRAALLTGRTNNRDCIDGALPCCDEDPAPTCSMGKHGALPHTEFTVAKAAKKSKLGDYATIHLGKWHLGDLWNKGLPGQHNLPGATVSSPGDAGFDEWLSTQAEASNSMPNCGCFPVNHSHPGPMPPSGYPMITPHGDQCVVGGGAPSDWCYPCTNYYYPNASDPRLVSELQERVAGDDSAFLIDHFDAFLTRQIAAHRPWLAHLCFHAIHEPHPAMPYYYHLYARDPDYLGALTMWDAQLGRLLGLLRSRGVASHTAILYTADNGPHQGLERSDIRWSTGFLRQCKASMFEGGIRVPGLVHFPLAIRHNVNVTTPATTADFLPTIMGLLQVTSDHPSWAMDGVDLLPLVAANPAPRGKPIGFDSTGGEHALIDENWKLLVNPKMGQCDAQPPYSKWTNLSKLTLLFDLDHDYHELHDLASTKPGQLKRMMQLLGRFLASVENSKANETRCGKYAPPSAPHTSLES